MRLKSPRVAADDALQDAPRLPLSPVTVHPLVRLDRLVDLTDVRKRDLACVKEEGMDAD